MTQLVQRSCRQQLPGYFPDDLVLRGTLDGREKGPGRTFVYPPRPNHFSTTLNTNFERPHFYPESVPCWYRPFSQHMEEKRRPDVVPSQYGGGVTKMRHPCFDVRGFAKAHEGGFERIYTEAGAVDVPKLDPVSKVGWTPSGKQLSHMLDGMGRQMPISDRYYNH